MEESNGEYVVVEFKDEAVCGELPMAVVSSTWIILDKVHGDFCYWPGYVNKINKLVIDHSEIDLEKSTKCAINIKYKSKNYTRACDKMKMLENQSSVSQSEIDDLSQNRNRRLTKKNTRFNDFNCEEDSDSYDNIPCPPKIIVPVKSFDVPTPQGSSYTILHSQQQKFNNNEIQSSETRFENSSCGLSIASSGSLEKNTCSRCKTNEEILITLMSKIEAIAEDIKFLMMCQSANSGNVEATAQIKQCATKEELQELDDSLTNEDKFLSMCTVLQTVGGKDPIDTTRRILSRLISRDLAILYNWTGRNNKQNFSTMKNVMKLVLVAVRRNPLSKSATQQQVEDITKVFLRNAGDRDGGRGRRQK